MFSSVAPDRGGYHSHCQSLSRWQANQRQHGVEPDQALLAFSNSCSHPIQKNSLPRDYGQSRTKNRHSGCARFKTGVAGNMATASSTDRICSRPGMAPGRRFLSSWFGKPTLALAPTESASPQECPFRPAEIQWRVSAKRRARHRLQRGRYAADFIAPRCFVVRPVGSPDLSFPPRVFFSC